MTINETHRILLVEDDKNLRDSLSAYLKNEGLNIDTADSLRAAQQSSLQKYELILLDWMLPDGAGIDLLPYLRQACYSGKIIFLTAKVETLDKVLALEGGAHDYITKPFDPRELLARIRVQWRKNPMSQVIFNGITLILDQRQVLFQNQILHLTKTEFDLLKFFMMSPDRVFSRDELLQSVWGFDQFPTTRTVDVHVAQLRQHLRPDFFETIHGIGYRMKRIL